MIPSLRRLQYFNVVSTTLHIGKAAELLGIAQPALSQQIKALETELGVRLFHRRKRGIDLTTAGEAYLIEVKRLLIQHEHATDVARRTARGELGSLQLGYVGSAMFEPEFPALLRQLRDRWPDIRLRLQEHPVQAQLHALAAGDIDVAVVRGPVPVGAMDTNVRKLVGSRRPLAAALPQGHRLLGKRRLYLADLAKEPMISFNDPPHLAIMQIASELAQRAGIELNVAWQVSEVASVLGLVAAGLGFGIVPASVAQLGMPSVGFRDLADTGAYAELWYLWHAERETPALKRFIALAGVEP